MIGLRRMVCLMVLVAFLQEILVSPNASAQSQTKTPSREQAVLKAFHLLAGRGYYRHRFEVAASAHNDTITVLFRRLTSQVIVTPGRLATKDIFKVSFTGATTSEEVLDKENPSRNLDARYTRQKDQTLAQAVIAACTYLWKKHKMDSEFAVDINENSTGYFVTLTYIPYTPDADRWVSLTKTLKVIR